MSGPPNVFKLSEDLESPDEAVRKRAVFQLGELLDLRAIPAIKRLAAEGSPETMYLARKLLALYEAKKPEARELIRPGAAPEVAGPNSGESAPGDLTSPDPAKRAAALRACAKANDKARLPQVLERTGYVDGHPKEPVPEVRSLLPLLLAQLAGAAQVQTVAAFLKDTDPRVKANALAALQAIGDQDSWSVIIRCVTDPDTRVKTAAISALAKLGRINLIKCCKAMIDQSGAEYWKRDAAIHLLAGSGLPDSVPLLAQALADPVPGVAQKARKGLERLAAKGVAAAAEALAKAGSKGAAPEKPEDFLKLQEVSAAPAAAAPASPSPAGGDDGDLLLVLDQARNEKDVATLVGILRRAGRIGNPIAVPLLRDFIKHASDEVRIATIEALKDLDTPEAMDAIRPALNDASSVVQAKAMIALDAGVPQEASLRPPIEIPGYEMQTLLGRGGMGAVWKARQLSLGRTVAVKILNPDVSRDQRFRKRFEREALVMSSLQHPGIVAILDRGEISGRCYLVMQFVDGPSLRAMLSQGAITPARAIEVTIGLLRALEHAHAQGVVHRDIKPDNVLIGADGLVKLSDFGIAGLSNEEQEAEGRLTGTGYVLGTLGYMSPEQATDSKRADHRSDLFSVGAMLFEALTGDLPMGVVQFPAERGLRVDRRIDEVLRKVLHTSMDKRHQSAAELIRDLEAVTKDSFVGAAPASAPASAPTAHASDSPARVARGDASLTPVGGPRQPSGERPPPRPSGDRPPPAPVVDLHEPPSGGGFMRFMFLVVIAVGVGLAVAPHFTAHEKAAAEHPVVASIPAEHPAVLVAAPDRVLVLCGAPEKKSSALVMVKGSAPTKVGPKLGSSPGGLAWLPEKDLALVGLAEEKVLVVIDLKGSAEKERVRLPLTPKSVGMLDDGGLVAAGSGSNAVFITPGERSLRAFDRQADHVVIPLHQKFVVLGSYSGVAVYERRDLVGGVGSIANRFNMPVPGLGGMVASSLGNKLYVSVPHEGRVLALSLPELKFQGARNVPKLASGTLGSSGTRLLVPTETGAALLDEGTEAVDPIECGEGAKNCLFVGRNAWVARRDATTIEAYE